MKYRGKFSLDRANGKLFGVCSGIANMTGIDATIVRVGVVVATLVGGFPWTVIAYVAAALIAKDPGRAEFDRDAFAARERMSTYRMATETRDIDRRIAEVESYVASRNSSLEREIEALRHQ
jgi:phage shock protein C